ncbi:hypothetical protein LSH36_283g02007 [Paralvinella palmiformis]|uniref:Uncharacterized protein n=1 Tax=Paralvinella palmiformis TaxID=53620 RepID=A0AAD9JJX5_9ANNE|nr:hypothetical protein LSH36_283g02007 [Paralvinella palmiformis]
MWCSGVKFQPSMHYHLPLRASHLLCSKSCSSHIYIYIYIYIILTDWIIIGSKTGNFHYIIGVILAVCYIVCCVKTLQMTVHDGDFETVCVFSFSHPRHSQFQTDYHHSQLLEMTLFIWCKECVFCTVTAVYQLGHKSCSL